MELAGHTNSFAPLAVVPRRGLQNGRDARSLLMIARSGFAATFDHEVLEIATDAENIARIVFSGLGDESSTMRDQINQLLLGKCQSTRRIRARLTEKAAASASSPSFVPARSRCS